MLCLSRRRCDGRLLAPKQRVDGRGFADVGVTDQPDGEAAVGILASRIVGTGSLRS